MQDVRFIDTTGWTEQFWLNSGGTRAKKILLDLQGDEWFFKCSEKKEEKDGKPAKYYRYEFWSEIIAYQLGNAWGLNILRYDPAINNNEIGCISRNMLTDDKEDLVEFGRFMTAISQDFIPAYNKARKEYTFQLLTETIDHFELTPYWDQILQTILFDAVIGNVDRHQENWAFIARSSMMKTSLDMMEEEVKQHGFNKLMWPVRSFYNRFFDKEKNKFNSEGEKLRLFFTKINRMAPIYDSGSSMARELTDEKVALLLRDDQQFNKYIESGFSEIHWMGKKMSHFNLISELLKTSYINSIENAALFLSKVNDEAVKDIINNIDVLLPKEWSHYRIPQMRKDLICKLVILRTEKIRGLLT